MINTIKNTSKTIAAAMTLLLGTLGFGHSIELNAPFSQAGSGQLTLRTLAKPLESMGYKLNITITSNHELSKKNYADANTPFLLGWETPAPSRTSPVYLAPPTASDLVGLLITTGHYVCTNKDVSFDDISNGEKLKIAYAAEYKWWLEDFSKITGANFEYVPYRGSSGVEKALVAGEVDIAMSTRGAGWQKKGIANCLFHTGLEPAGGIKPIADIYSKWDGNPLLFVMYLKAKNMSDEQLNKLRSDLDKAKRSSPEFAALVEKKSWTPVVGMSIDDQIAILNQMDKQVK